MSSNYETVSLWSEARKARAMSLYGATSTHDILNAIHEKSLALCKERVNGARAKATFPRQATYWLLGALLVWFPGLTVAVLLGERNTPALNGTMLFFTLVFCCYFTFRAKKAVDVSLAEFRSVLAKISFEDTVQELLDATEEPQ